jgi:hypothetical protein
VEMMKAEGRGTELGGISKHAALRTDNCNKHSPTEFARSCYSPSGLKSYPHVLLHVALTVLAISSPDKGYLPSSERTVSDLQVPFAGGHCFMAPLQPRQACFIQSAEKFQLSQP